MAANLKVTPIKKSRVYEEVVDQMKNAIFEGQLKAGESLPSERQLCEMFGVGRPAIREALRTLNVLGLIEVVAGQPARVSKESSLTYFFDVMRESLALMIKLNDDKLNHIMEVRTFVELGIAHAAAKRATEEDFAELENLIKEMEANDDDFFTYFPLAAEFHVKLALATKNSIFYILEKLFYDILHKGYMPIMNKHIPKGPKKLLELNKTILKAIKSKNPERINKAMKDHASAESYFDSISPENTDHKAIISDDPTR
ncbi:MAG: FadR/GntR family transcriptional regulator [Thermodesulfobacteriota bacterium]